jgi:hypothetical protein
MDATVATDATGAADASDATDAGSPEEEAAAGQTPDDTLGAGHDASTSERRTDGAPTQ